MARRSTTSRPAGSVVTGLVYQAVSTFSTDPQWSPPINVYQRAHRLEVCVELAGVDREQVDVHVEPGRLTIRGARRTPDPPGRGGKRPQGPMRILAMEIDHGRFSRVIAIPNQVRLDRVQSTYREGLLWVILPMHDED